MMRNNWSLLLESHRKRSGLHQENLAKLVGISQGAISDYEKSKLAPPLALLSDIADHLSLHGTERATFFEEAYLAHAPDKVRTMVADLRARIGRLERLCRQNGFQLPDL